MLSQRARGAVYHISIAIGNARCSRNGATMATKSRANLARKTCARYLSLMVDDVVYGGGGGGRWSRMIQCFSILAGILRAPTFKSARFQSSVHDGKSSIRFGNSVRVYAGNLTLYI